MIYSRQDFLPDYSFVLVVTGETLGVCIFTRRRRPRRSFEEVSDLDAAFRHTARAEKPAILPHQGRAGTPGQAAKSSPHATSQEAQGVATPFVNLPQTTAIQAELGASSSASFFISQNPQNQTGVFA